MNDSKTGSIYIPDTNILFAMVSHIATDNAIRPYWQLDAAIEFMEYFRSDVHILDLVLAEFHGVFLHKQIDFSDYDLQYRDRLSLMEKVFKRILDSRMKLISLDRHDLYRKVFRRALALTRMPLPGTLVAQLRASAEQRPVRPAPSRPGQNTSRASGCKALDGMDSAIAAYASLVGAASPERMVTILTLDMPLATALQYFKTHRSPLEEGCSWPGNVGVYTAYDMQRVIRKL